jgi:hypothetical protein
MRVPTHRKGTKRAFAGQSRVWRIAGFSILREPPARRLLKIRHATRCVMPHVRARYAVRLTLFDLVFGIVA